MPFTEFQMDVAAGSNLNSGCSPGAATYTTIHGNWNASTGVFTPTDGSTPASTVPTGTNSWVSIYPDANTVTPYIAQVTAVAAGVNGAITVSSVAFFGSAPATNSGATSLKYGGAWLDLGMTAVGAALNTGAVPYSPRFNVKAGTYANTTTSRTFGLSGAVTNCLWWRGFKNTPGDQDYNPTPVAGTDIPLFTGTTGVFTVSGAYTRMSSLAFTSAQTSAAATVTTTGTDVAFYGCSFATTSTTAGAASLYVNSGSNKFTFCTFSATSSVTNNFQPQAGGNHFIDGCIISGGVNGLKAVTGAVNITNCIFTGQSGDSIQAAAAGTYIDGCTIYNTGGNGINISGAAELYVKNTYFEGMPAGKYAINNTSGTQTSRFVAVANSYYNVGGMINGVGDYPPVFDNGVLPSSGVRNAAGGDFTPTPNLWADGFPGKFLGTSTYQGYQDVGAVQSMAAQSGLIVESVGMPAATGRASQSHLVYAANQGVWWLFYFSGNQALSAIYSSDFMTWTTPGGSPFTLLNTHNGEGRNLSILYKNIASTDVVHVLAFGGTQRFNASRFTLGATWTNTNAEALISTYAGSISFGFISQGISSANLPWCEGNALGGTTGAGGQSALNTDAGTSWTAGYNAASSVWFSGGAGPSSGAVFSLGSTNMLALTDNWGTTNGFTNLVYSLNSGTNWASTGNTVLASAVIGADANAWGAIDRTSSDIHVVALSNNSNTYVHRRFNGTAWANGDSVPNLAYGTNSGIYLGTDGTSVWAFVFDTSKQLQFSQWVAGTGWSAWSVLRAARVSTPAYLTGTYNGSGAFGLVWTEATGGGIYNIAGTTFGTGAGAVGGGGAVLSRVFSGF